jgi:hypothetical protein
MEFVHWHYKYGAKGVMSITMNLIWFVFHFFSTGFLLRTFVMPFMRVDSDGLKKGTVNDFLQNKLINILFRFIGMVVRSAFIFLSTLLAGLVVIAGIATFVIWVFLPAVPIVGLIFLFV